jgi:hypothetical protein
MNVESGTACRIAGAVVMALALGACSSGNALTTGTLLGSNSQKAAAPPPPETPTDRALHVATTSARATRCGYVFDPAAVRQSYLAFESQQAGAADQAAKAQQSYDFTLTKVSTAIAGVGDYCSEDMTAAIKRDLTQVLAGNYASPTRAQANVGWWSANRTVAPLDREKLFKPEW